MASTWAEKLICYQFFQAKLIDRIAAGRQLLAVKG